MSVTKKNNSCPLHQQRVSPSERLPNLALKSSNKASFLYNSTSRPCPWQCSNPVFSTTDDFGMDTEAKPSARDLSRSLEVSSDSDSGSDSDSETGSGRANNSDSQATAAPKVEWLATTRQRRSTAGNRMKSMLANEEPDSDLELLFAEDENDQGFSDAGDDGSDVQMDSTDDEDENNNADDDLEGEKELEKQAKERRAAQRKRKAQEAIPAKFRKKVRIDPAAPTRPPAPAPRPKKKSERTSWLPSAADMPTRASSRKTTRISKEQLHQQMVEREARRLKQLAQMQKKAERLEALKKPPKTQEERLREAAIVEKRNSKSLNRWEEAEKQREEERRAKLAALNQRTLKGPVITFWSGIGEWMGKNMVVEEAPKKKRERGDKAKAKSKDKVKNEAPETQGQETAKNKGSDADGAPANAKGDSVSKPTSETPPQPPQSSLQLPILSAPAASSSAPEAAPGGGSIVPVKVEEPPQIMRIPTSAPSSQGLAAPPPSPPPPQSLPATTGGLAAPVAAPAPISPLTTQRSCLTPPPGLSRPPESKPSGVLAPPMLAPPPGITVNGASTPMLGLGSGSPKSNVLALPMTSQGMVPPALPSIAPSMVQSPPLPPAAPLVPLKPAPQPDSTRSPAPTTNAQFQLLTDEPSTPITPEVPPQPPRPPQPTTGARNSIIFQNFDQNALKDRNVQTQIIFGRKMTKLPSK